MWAGDRGPLPRSCWKRHLLTVVATLGLSKSGFSHRANWKVLGGRNWPGWSWGDSPLQALGFTVNLVHLWPIGGCSLQRDSQRRACGDTKNAVGPGALDSLSPQNPQAVESPGPLPPAACEAATSVTLFVNTHETKTPRAPPPLPRGHAAPRSSRGGSANGRGRCRRLTVRGGSSSPGPCTSRRGAGGAPCSGQTRPGHRASPGVSACAGTR